MVAKQKMLLCYQETSFRNIKGWWFLFTEHFDILGSSLQ